MRRRGGRDSSAHDGEDFTRVEPRIEPSLGSPLDILDEAPATPRRRERKSPPRDVLMDSREDMVPDVLLEAPNPRRRQSPDTSTERPTRPARREQGYARVTPRGERMGNHKARVAKPDFFAWFDPRWLWVPLMVCLAVGGYWAYEPLEKLLERPFKSVVVEGEFHFITKARATELISDEIDNNFLQLDLMRLKRTLTDDPWVDSVSLQRRWPDTLVVKIAEQKPIARWGDGFLNQRGQIVRVKEIDRLSGLPWLQGNESDAVEILQQYQDLSQLLRSRGLDVIALKCDNKKSWRLTLKNDVEIAIGRDKVMEKMRRFVTVYDTHLNSVWIDIAAIDVRYSNGLAVRWVEGSESAKKYLRVAAATTNATRNAPTHP